MNLVAPLIGFGLLFLAGGFFWKLIDDVIDLHFLDFIQYNKYYTFSQLEWDMIPWILMIMGVLCLIGAGISYGQSRTVIKE